MSTQALCPDCGHTLIHHSSEHFWRDGSTCTKCASGPSPWARFDKVCCLTSHEVRRVIDAGAPECPNHDDEVLCAWDVSLGRIVPEAGCPLHDHALYPTKESA